MAAQVPDRLILQENMKSNRTDLQIGEPELHMLQEEILSLHGYDFRGYSEAFFRRRLLSFLESEGIEGCDRLGSTILNDEERFERFLRMLTVNATGFFRDPEFYLALRNSVFPVLHTYPYVRIWCAGCSTGEEAYSLAVLLEEEGLYQRSRIYATDINQEVLDKAEKGIFPISGINEYRQNYLNSGGMRSFSDYFKAGYEDVEMHSALRKNMIFSHHNLAGDSSFNEFHLILCRNVMIYFKEYLRKRVIKLLFDSLAHYGVLCVGTKESIEYSDYIDNFEAVDDREKIFRKIK